MKAKLMRGIVIGLLVTLVPVICSGYEDCDKWKAYCSTKCVPDSGTPREGSCVKFMLDDSKKSAIGRVVTCEGKKSEKGACLDYIWVKLTSINTRNNCLDHDGKRYCQGDEIRWSSCLDIYLCD